MGQNLTRFSRSDTKDALVGQGTTQGIRLERDEFSRIAAFLDEGDLGCVEQTCKTWYRWVGDNSEKNPEGTNCYGVLALNRGLPLPAGHRELPRDSSSGYYTHCGPFPSPPAGPGGWKEHLLGFVPPPPGSRRAAEARQVVASATEHYPRPRLANRKGMGAILQGGFERVTALHSCDWHHGAVSPMDDATLQAIVDCCPNLQCLVLASPGAQVVTADLRHGQQLRSVKICASGLWSENVWLRTVNVSCCRSLETLRIRACPNLTRLDTVDCPSLHEIHLQRCGIATLDFNRCAALATLEVKDCHQLTVLDLRQQRLLRTLHLKNCSNLSRVLLPGHQVDVRRVRTPGRILNYP